MRTFTARPPRARWRRTLAIAFVLATLAGGFLDGIVSAEAAPAPPADAIPGQVVVRFTDGTASTARAQVQDAVGATEVARIDALDLHVLQVPEHAMEPALQGLRRNPHVAYAERDRVVEVHAELVPNDYWYDAQWALPHVNAPKAWGLTTGSTDVRIAVLDTGVSRVAELDSKLLPGWNAMDGSTTVTDTHGHGTMSAGVAASETNNTDGVASLGFDSSILPVKVMETGSGAMSDLTAGIVWAADHGADVINMSLSGSSGPSSLHDAVKYAVERDVVLVAAAGNNGDTTPRYPAAFPEVIGVAGTDSADTLYSWSNYGAWVDVAAPGFNRAMTKDGTISSYAGTSSATPVVAGLAALAAATGASAPDIRQAIQVGAVPLDVVAHGRVDAHATLLELPAGDGSTTSEPEPKNEPANTAPTADLQASCTDLACTFDGAGSTDSDGTISGYLWDLGDGTSAAGATVSHTYAAGGSYTVALTVTDDDGATATTEQVVEVTAPASTDPEPTTTSDGVTVTTGSTNDRGSWTAWADVTVVVDGSPAVGTSVTATWTGDGKHGATGTVSCTTDADGTCRLAVSQANNVGSVTFDIDTVAGATTATATKP